MYPITTLKAPLQPSTENIAVRGFGEHFLMPPTPTQVSTEEKDKMCATTFGVHVHTMHFTTTDGRSIRSSLESQHLCDRLIPSNNTRETQKAKGQPQRTLVGRDVRL